MSDWFTDFEYEEEKDSQKEGIVLFGQKGSGKTSGAYMMPGVKTVLSFDGKSLRAKETLRPDDDEIRILNARKYVQYFKPKAVESAAKNFDYALWLLNEVKKRGGTDWVIIDGLDILIELAEFKMRHDHKLGPFQTFANLNLWKDRKLNLRAVFGAAFDCAKKGVIYTTYTAKDEIVNNATLVKSDDVPKWMDIVMYDTDAVVKTTIEDGKFLMTVVSSKIARFKTGDVIDVTGKLSLDEPDVVDKIAPEDLPDLAKASKRKKARQRLKNCPECGSETVTSMGVLHCSKDGCDWVHEDEV